MPYMDWYRARGPIGGKTDRESDVEEGGVVGTACGQPGEAPAVPACRRPGGAFAPYCRKCPSVIDLQ